MFKGNLLKQLCKIKFCHKYVRLKFAISVLKFIELYVILFKIDCLINCCQRVHKFKKSLFLKPLKSIDNQRSIKTNNYVRI